MQIGYLIGFSTQHGLKEELDSSPHQTISPSRCFTLLNTSAVGIMTWLPNVNLNFGYQPLSHISFVTLVIPKNSFEFLERVLRLFSTCSQKEHLVWERKGREMWDVLGPLNKLKELLIGCLANVGHCWLKTHNNNYNQSPCITFLNQKHHNLSPPVIHLMLKNITFYLLITLPYYKITLNLLQSHFQTKINFTHLFPSITLFTITP
jgi:hypothetical protein